MSDKPQTLPLRSTWTDPKTKDEDGNPVDAVLTSPTEAEYVQLCRRKRAQGWTTKDTVLLAALDYYDSKPRFSSEQTLAAGTAGPRREDHLYACTWLDPRADEGRGLRVVLKARTLDEYKQLAAKKSAQGWTRCEPEPLTENERLRLENEQLRAELDALAARPVIEVAGIDYEFAPPSEPDSTEAPTPGDDEPTE